MSHRAVVGDIEILHLSNKTENKCVFNQINFDVYDMPILEHDRPHGTTLLTAKITEEDFQRVCCAQSCGVIDFPVG